MKIITFEDIKNLNISPAKCYEWTEQMIKNKRDALLPPKISIKPREGVFCNVMPSMIPSASMGFAGGIKVVTRYPERVPSLESQIMLLDADNGDILALMDATWITTMRTGAVAAHTINLLAKKDFSTIGLMGLGNVVRSTIIVLAAIMPEKEFNIKLLKFNDEEKSFMERFADYKNLHFTVVDTPQEMVKGSDVVVSGATYLPTDVCEDEFFDEGILVVPIHTLGFTNCDLFFDKVFADDTGHVCHFKNFDKFRSFAEVCDVVNNKVKGRENDKERILAYNIGISVHDVNFAANIYKMFTDKKTIEVDMVQPTERFWV